MTRKREKQFKQLAIAINAVVAAELVVYFGSLFLLPGTAGSVTVAFLTVFIIVTATAALANLIVLTPLVTRGKTVKPQAYKAALAVMAISILYLAFIIFPLAGSLGLGNV